MHWIGRDCQVITCSDMCIGSASVPSTRQGAVATPGKCAGDQVCIKLWTWLVDGKPLVLGIQAVWSG